MANDIGIPISIQDYNGTAVKMPASHSNLHFVNLSKPNEGKDKETRRAVRTHVMQQFIQKKRLREKRREKQTPLERALQLECICPTIQAVPQAFDTSSNWQSSETVSVQHVMADGGQ